MTMSDDLLALAKDWWTFQRSGLRQQLATSIDGRALAARLDRILSQHIGDPRMCVCSIPERGHDMRCPARPKRS